MGENIVFGECLKRILYTLNISNVKLARAVNVDPSLVNRWIHGKRVPSEKSNHIEHIIEFICSQTIYPFQENALEEVLMLYDSNFTGSDYPVKHKIELALRQSLSYSHSHKQTIRKQAFTNNMPVINFDNCRDTLSSYNLIIGKKEVFQTLMQLLKAAEEADIIENEPILISFSTDTDYMYYFEEFFNEWKQAVYSLLSKGWKVIALVDLNGNLEQIISLIDAINVFSNTGNFMPYYKKLYSISSDYKEVVVIPGIGGMICFPCYNRTRADSALIFSDRLTVEVLKNHYHQMLRDASPLIIQYSESQDLSCFKKLTEFEEEMGSRYLFKEGISTISIPFGLYEQYLKISNKTSIEISEGIDCHARRIQAFQNNIQNFEYKDIYTKQSIERLVKYGDYPGGECNMIENEYIDREYIIRHLQNLTDILRRYDNYEIALINEKQLNGIKRPCCMIKQKSGVIINTYHYNIKGDTNKIKNIALDELTLVNGFEKHFKSVWSQIPRICRDKKEVIEWFESMLKILNG